MSDQYKKQLFDKDLVFKITAAAITLYLLEDNDEIEVNEKKISDFVIKNFPQIVESVTSE
jgi:hypothetical protein